MKFNFEGTDIDSIDLKALLISRGVRISNEVYSKFNNQARLSKNPLECNTIRLPDGTIVQLTDLSFHLEYVQSISALAIIKQIKYLPQLRTSFNLNLDENNRPAIYLDKQKITEVEFIEHSNFYKQKTSSGLPFLGNAVLQGTEWLSFPFLWKCDFGLIGEPCQYCFPAGELASLSKEKQKRVSYPTPEDVAEIVEYAILKEKCANSIQFTGGTIFNDQAELEIIRNILKAIDKRVGLQNIPGEIVAYITPPKNPEDLDLLFELGVSRIACSLEIWDEELAAKIMPAKTRFTGKQRHLDSLRHVASKYGKNKACSNFIIGLEPAESVIAGAEYLASNGIVPMAPVWIPFGRPVLDSMKTPDLAFYQTVKNELSRIYKKHGVIPPGGKGLNVCIDRDIYLQTA